MKKIIKNKKFFAMIVVPFFAAVIAGIVINLNVLKNRYPSDLFLANVEALAKPEWDGEEGTCGWGVETPESSVVDFMAICGIPKEEALFYFSEFGGNWRCDSCGSTWYCGNG